jgi:predicted dehydrogenase
VVKKYLQGVSTYKSYEELFDKESLDAVVICTPPNLHSAIAKEAGNRNVHVFCEKPFTTQKHLGIALADLFESKRLVNQVGYVNRCNDVFRKTKTLLDSNVVGKVIRFKSEMYSRTITKPDSGNTWRDSRESGGGALFEMASHAIDLINFLVGKPDKVTGSSLTRIYSKHVEDAVNSSLLYKSGISGILSVNWSDESYRKPTNKIEVFGSNGTILADQHGLKLFLKNALPDQNLREGWNTLHITDVFKPVPFYVRGNEFTEQIYSFVDCVRERKNTVCSFRDASATLEVIEAIMSDYERNGRL